MQDTPGDADGPEAPRGNTWSPRPVPHSFVGPVRFEEETMQPKSATRPADTTRRTSRAAWPLLLLALSALQLQSGCGREFFREWANQDVSQAIFEKSRDPRWVIDLYSHTPPAMSRFADPYDPDNPPAPPDDFAAEALSPVPQWPGNRLLVPLEGTGYLTMMDQWRRDRPVESNDAMGGPEPAVTSPAGMGRPAYDPGPTVPITPDASPFVPAPPLPGPARAPAQLPAPPPIPPIRGSSAVPPAANSGTTVRPLTPLTDRTVARPPSVASTGRTPVMPTVALKPSTTPKRDLGVQLASHQLPAPPLPCPPLRRSLLSLIRSVPIPSPRNPPANSYAPLGLRKTPTRPTPTFR